MLYPIISSLAIYFPNLLTDFLPNFEAFNARFDVLSDSNDQALNEIIFSEKVNYYLPATIGRLNFNELFKNPLNHCFYWVVQLMETYHLKVIFSHLNAYLDVS